MKVKVIVSIFGTHKKGDELEMHKTTAAACIKHGKVVEIGKEKPAPKTSKK